MITYDEALGLVLDAAGLAEPEWLPLTAARGRTIASPVKSPTSLPPFSNAAMDGFALATGDGALPPGSVLPVTGSTVCGDPPAVAGDEAGAWRITTGAPLPRGMNAVTPKEAVEVLEGDESGATRIRLTRAVDAGQHVRRPGEDFRAGDPVLAVGASIGPVEVMALAALGVHRVAVFRRPRATVLSTGSELMAASGEPPPPGRIRDANGPCLEAALERAGCTVLSAHAVEDDPDPFVQAVRHACRDGTELIVSTGAVSAGSRDFVPDALRSIDARTHFHGVAIRPGKPLLAATLPGGTMFFGLPGNPVSALVGFRFFVQPYLHAMLGRAPDRPWPAQLVDGVRKRPGLRYFQRARFSANEKGEARVRMLSGQASFQISSLLEANAWVVLPEGPEALPAGTCVDVHPFAGGAPDPGGL